MGAKPQISLKGDSDEKIRPNSFAAPDGRRAGDEEVEKRIR